MSRRVVAVAAMLIAAHTLSAEQFRFQYEEGEQYRIVSTVEQDVIINGVFSHTAEILNRVSLEVVAVDGSTGTIQATFQTSERAIGESEVYEWSQEYFSRFDRTARGVYDIAPHFFMPVVRDVPIFPEREVAVGDTWSVPGHEVHDLRANFGIPTAFRFPINVSYRYVGVEEVEGEVLHVITIDYTVFYRSPPIQGADLYPTRITGYSSQRLIWNNRIGRAGSIEDEFEFVFDLSTGDTVEYLGTATAGVVEATRMDRVRVADEIADELNRSNIQDTEVSVSDEGVTVSLSNIQFQPESAVSLSSEKQKLDVIGEILRRYPDRDILITGHTALAGTEEGRQWLSEQRAQSVAGHLIAAGVRSPEQVVTRGMGARAPIADNTTEAGMRRNRRVEITILEN